MWFAVAIIGIIAIATGITLLPGGMPSSSQPPAASAPAPAPTAPMTTPVPPAGAAGTGAQ